MNHREYSESRVNLGNLIAYLFSKVFYIMVPMVVFSIFFIGLRISKTASSTASRTEDLRRQLSEVELSEADGIISRYIFCLEYVFGVTDNMRLMRNTYLIDTGNYPADVLSNAIVMNDEEYSNVLDIVKIDDDGYHKLSDRVMVQTYSSETADDNELFVVATVYGFNDEQCSQAMSAIEQFIDRVQNDFGLGSETPQWKLVSSVCSSVDSNNITISRDDRIERLNKVGGSLSSLSNAVGYLTEEQKEYINSIVKPLKNDLIEFDSEEVEISTTSILKYAILGASFGFILSVGTLILFYLLNGKVKTTDDISASWDGLVLDPVLVPEKRNSIGRAVLRRLKGVDADAIAVNKAVAVSRISEAVNKLNPRRVLFVHDAESEACKFFAKELMAEKGITDAVDVFSCSMSDFTDICLTLNDNDAVIVLAELGKTKQKSINRWLDFCKKNAKTIVGVATVDQNC